mmetsp:Transcript_41691/g.69447  ORF Transcript_41691/g.69447 Transcript_41691/m.69447 type:complete len:1481 (-) Transcript_41691:1256-5698(-)
MDLPQAQDTETTEMLVVEDQTISGTANASCGSSTMTTTMGMAAPGDENSNSPIASGAGGPLASVAEMLEPVCMLRNTLSAVLSKMAAFTSKSHSSSPCPTPPPVVSSPPSSHVWGNLLSQFPQQPHLPLSGAYFSIGRNSRCHFQLRDLGVSGVLCRIYHSHGVVFLESMSSSGILHVNGRILRKGMKQVLKSGDEITIIGSMRNYSFVFQQLAALTAISSSTMVAPVASSSSTSTSTARPSNVTSFSASLLSSFASLAPSGPSMSSSLLNSLHEASSTLPGTSSSDTPVVPQVPSSPDKDSSVPEPTRAGSAMPLPVIRASRTLRRPVLPNLANSAPIPSVGFSSKAVSSPKTSSETMVLPSAASILAAAGPLTSSAAIRRRSEKRPIVLSTRAVATGVSDAAMELDSSTNTSALVDGASTPAKVSSASAASMATAAATAASKAQHKQIVRDELLKKVLKPDDIMITFDSFPYYLSEDVKQLLINSAYLFLKRPEFVKYTSELSTVSRRILLTGPVGADIYLETVVKALAKHLGANLILFDATCAFLEGSSSGTGTEGQAPSASSLLAADFVPVPDIGGSGGDDLDMADIWSSLDGPNASSIAASPAAAMSASASLSSSLSQRRMFKKGDRVKYVGSLGGGGGLGGAASAYFSSPYAIDTAARVAGRVDTSGHRGPAPGFRGKVVLTFDDNPKKVGVRFDKFIPGGNNLGNLCEDNHGFFVNTADLRPENDPNDSNDALAMEVLFEMISSSTDANETFVVFVPDVEKSVMSTYERYTNFKRELDKLQSQRVIIVGATTSSPERRERGGPFAGTGPGSLMFGKANGGGGGAGHHASSLLDVSFLDHFSRMEDRIKDTSKSHKMLARLFPAKIVMSPPQDDTMLAKWKRQIERDVEYVKSETNKANLRRVLEKNNIECDSLDPTVMKDQVFPTEAVERIVGYAVSHHLMQSYPDDPPPPPQQEPSPFSVPTTSENQSSTSTAAATTTTTVVPIPDQASVRDQVPASVPDTDSEMTPATEIPSAAEPIPGASEELPKIDTASTVQPATHPEESASDKNKESVMQQVAHVEEMVADNKDSVVQLAALPEEGPAVVDKEDKVSTNVANGVLVKGGRLVISSQSVTAGIEIFNALQAEVSPLAKSLKDVNTENEFEKRLLGEVIPPYDIGVRFDDIGALDKVKESLKEIVMLPLQRPELFRKGNLTKPCKGILLFGPPGTGKTMLAKAVATEAGANFINITMSAIASKWFGEGEKYVRAVFTLASKISPAVIFIDEVDSMLGKREKHGEHEATRKIKNEFMSMWDGLKTKENERVLVLAATNRPFDLDEAVLRRFRRRFLVDLPDAENRMKIVRVILGKEDLASDVEMDALAAMTEGYSGSDLKNLCVSAAYQPIREFLEHERKSNMQPSKKKRRHHRHSAMGESDEEETGPALRALRMRDFEKAKEEISVSVSEDAFSIGELRKWNDIYGEGGSRRKDTLSYFM